MSIASRIESMTEHLRNDWDSIDSLGLYTKKLPKEYTQVDYIESSGTQYIDTGVNADYKLSVITELSVSSAGGSFGAISGTDPYVRYYFNFTSGQGVRLYYSDSPYVQLMLSTDDINNKHKYLIDMYKKKVRVDEGEYIDLEYNTNFDTRLKYWIFRRNADTDNLKAYTNTKIYSFQMYYENRLIRDFIPCYRNSDNEVGLYDLVNNVFYTNQGTGAFTYGEIQEEHIDRNLENLNLPLKDLYNDVSDKTDLSVNGVVGRTSQERTTGKNLLPPTLATDPNYTKGTTTTYDSNTGYYTTTGTTTNSYPWLVNANVSISTGTTLTISSNSSYRIYARLYYNSSSYEEINSVTTPTKTVSNNIIRIAILSDIPKDTQVNETYYVQLEEGSTATSFEPYTNEASPNPDYPQPINNLSGDIDYKVSGKNKLPFPYTESTHTHNGITFTIYNDGSVLVNGTATGGNANTKLYGDHREQNQLKFPGKYLSGGTTNVWLRAINNHGGNYSLLGNDTGKGAEIDTTTYDIGYIELTVKNGTTVNNQLIKPMVLNSLEDTAYEPYISQTFNIPLKSKNLFDGEVETGGWNITNGEQLTKSTTTHQLRCANKIIVKPNKEYIFSLNGNQITENTRYIFVDKNNVIISSTVTATGKVTTPNNCEYLVFHSSDLKTNYDSNLPNPMIEENNETTDYEPYYNIELCKIDTYEDKIYPSNGRFYLNKETDKVILDGTQILSKAGTVTKDYYRFNVDIGRNIFTTDSTTIIAPIYCNRLIAVSRTNTFGKIEGIAPTTTNYSYKSFNLYIEELSQMTAEEANIWFSNNNTIVYYVLATPTTTEITQENYPALYNALKQIQDYLTAYKINKEFILGYSSPEIEY